MPLAAHFCFQTWCAAVPAKTVAIPVAVKAIDPSAVQNVLKESTGRSDGFVMCPVCTRPTLINVVIAAAIVHERHRDGEV